jgi:hypothetical protein
MLLFGTYRIYTVSVMRALVLSVGTRFRTSVCVESDQHHILHFITTTTTPLRILSPHSPYRAKPSNPQVIPLPCQFKLGHYVSSGLPRVQTGQH